MDSMSEAFDQMQMVKDVMANSDKVSEVLQESTHQFNLLTSPLPTKEKLGIAGALQRPTTSIMFGDATSKSPLGVFKNYHLKIGECIIQTDLTVMEMEEEKDLPLLLGTPFLSTVGASIDFHKQEVILHKERVDKEPRVGKDKDERGPRIEKPRLERARVEKPRRALKEGEDVASKARPGDKRKDPPAQAPSFKPSQLTMTLFPTKFENGKIEYKIRYKGRSRPFSRAKALVTSEQSRDPTKLKELLSQVLTITLDGDKGASSTDSSIELETGQLDRVPQLDQGTLVKKQCNKMTNSEGSRASQRRMVEGESSNARERRLKMQADLERMIRGWKSLMQRDMSTLRRQSESERLREERRTKKRNDPISSESEQGEFEIGVNLVQEEGNGSPNEEGSDETESEEEGEEVNQLVDEVSKRTKMSHGGG
ncbi:unnamed protein product [Microthlaspi erraticum]|uniref:Aspartic peptidase DDI1-type domain-containing protein n=1 Tax=Microthlaspi erraticum TaxID=1685480 RepID=A0A6D2LIE3_9BRAS|nr:unnamed protein product [Microthlaspi erraticum]